MSDASDTPEDWVSFGDVARQRLGEQCQYGRHHLKSELGVGVRWRGSFESYHGLEIHRDDVEAFVERVMRRARHALEARQRASARACGPADDLGRTWAQRSALLAEAARQAATGPGQVIDLVADWQARALAAEADRDALAEQVKAANERALDAEANHDARYWRACANRLQQLCGENFERALFWKKVAKHYRKKSRDSR